MKVVNSQIAAKPRRDELMGMEGWRIPATGLRSDVTLHNNLGRMKVPEEEIAESASRWNMTPVTLGHPSQRGMSQSGRTEGAVNGAGVGFLTNSREEDGELKTDVFLPDHRIEQFGLEESVIETVQNGKPVDVSTAFSGDFEQQSDHIVGRRLQPDHFAILLDEKGACSVSDGCGLGINHDGSCETEDDMESEDAENVADTVFNRIKNWFESEVQTPEEGTMNEEQIAELSEATGLSEEHLEDMEDDALQSLAENVLDADEGAEESEEEPETAENSEEAEIPEAVQNKLDRLESEVEALSAERREEKEGLVSALAENERCPFGEDELEDFELDRLQGLAQMAKVRNYGGRGGPRVSENSDGDDRFYEWSGSYAKNEEEG